MPLTPEAMKKINTNSIYKTLIELGSATKQEIFDKTQISLTTIRSVCEELILKNQIIETNLDISSGGRRARRYVLNPNKNLILLLHFANDKIRYQISSLSGETIGVGVEEFNLSNITEFIDFIMTKWDIAAIGIGISGIAEKGTIYSGCNITELEKNNIGERLQEKYGIQVILENEVNAIAYGYAYEHILTQDESVALKVNLSYIYFGKKGVRAGFICDGKIIHGSSQFAGELGFMPISADENLSDFMNASPNFEDSIDVICRTIAIINCITNPPIIVLNSDIWSISAKNLEQLSNHLEKYYLTQTLCPHIFLAENHQDKCLVGLKKLTIEHISPLLPL